MKNAKLLVIVGLGLVSTVILGEVAGAESVDTTTQGKVTFKEPEGPTNPDGPFALIKPGTYDEWITIKENEGKQTLDSKFRFAFVPNFDFGTVEVSSTDKYHNLQHSIPYQGYNPDTKNDFDAADVANRPIKHLPPFLQVVNLKGDAEYKVSVKAGKFKDATGTARELDNTTIQIKDFLTKNNVLNKENPNGSADAILEAPDASLLASDGYLHLTDNSDLVIMKTKSGQGTKTAGSASSLVFQEGYDLGTDYTKEVVESSESVRLFVPASDAPQTGVNYTADVTWTLEDTI